MSFSVSDIVIIIFGNDSIQWVNLGILCQVFADIMEIYDNFKWNRVIVSFAFDVILAGLFQDVPIQVALTLSGGLESIIINVNVQL